MATLVTRTSPQVRLSASDDATGTNDCVVLNPGCADGELLIAIQSQTGGTANAMQAETGDWQQRGATGGSASVGFMKVWYRRASNEPDQWSFGKDGDGVVTVLVLTNWDDRGAVGSDDLTWDVEPTFGTGSATTTHTSPTITNDRTLNRVIRAYASESGGGTHSTPAGYTEHQDKAVPGGHNHSVASQEAASAGATGTVNSTSSTSSDYVSVAFAISSPPNQASTLYEPSVRLPHWSTADNTLVLLIGANSNGASGATDCQVSSVIDDAHNVWKQGVTVFAEAAAGEPYTSVRGAIWYCEGAKAITQLTVTMTQIVDALAIEVLEWNGITNTTVVDITASNENSSTTGLTASGTTTNANDVVIAMAVNGDSSKTLAHTADTWTVTTGAVTDSQVTTKDDVAILGAYKDVSAAGAQSTAFTNSAAAVMGWCLIALKEGSVSTTNPNPNWPAVVHELGFGSDPNDPTATITYTAVTPYVNRFACQRGRDYEFGRGEAGELEAGVNNLDARFSPMNTASPYYPNVRVITPYRVRATWNGKQYHIFTGYVERWPQKWEDQRGVSRLQVVDGLATLAGSRLAGALGAEIIADGPHAYWPLNDGRLSEQAANKATTTSTPLSIATSTAGGGTAGFGATLALQGEDSTCWSQSLLSTTTPDATATHGKCLSAGMDLPQLADGILIECWAKIAAHTTLQTYTLLALKAEGFSAQALRRVAVLQIDTVSGLPSVSVSTSGGTLTTYNASASGYHDSAWHHYVVHLTSTTVKLWVDGVERVSGTLASVPAATIDRISVGGEVDTWSNQNIAAGEFAHVAVFEIASVDSRRVAARANAGLFGFPERSGARVTRVLNYSGWKAGRAIDQGQTSLGAANTIPRQTLLAAVQDIAAWENGLAFVDASGQFRFADRSTRFNQNIKYVFGDGTGEIPYETDVEVDYDPRYVFNDVTITKSAGRTPTGQTVAGGSSAHKKDQASVDAYFTRTLDKTSGASSVGQLDAEATWVLENYAQPRPRLSRIAFTPSANPALWEVALSIEIGDRVLVRRRPFGGQEIELDCYVEQVGHSVQPNEWKVVLSLTPALLSTYGAQTDWILNSSALDVDTIVGD